MRTMNDENILKYKPLLPDVPRISLDQLEKRKNIGSMVKKGDMRQLVKDIRNGTWNGSLDLGGMSYEEFVRRVEAGEYDRMKGLTQP